MISKTTKDFQNKVLSKMTFKAFPCKNYIIYKNENRPELGYFIKYSREGYYDFWIGDYTIPEDFSISFEHKEHLMRFGTVYTGETQFEIENNPIYSFSPSSFFVSENEIKGKQTWKKGQHFHGAEITIHKRYFDEIINPNFPKIIDFDNFINNYTYRYLPLEEDNAVAGLVEINYGIAVVPKISSLKYYNVKVLPIVNPSHERFIYLATLKNRYLTPSVNLFKKYIIDNF